MALSVVVEGFGDVPSLPILIAKTAQAFGIHEYAVNTVRAGGWPKLRQPGQLERFCQLAASHDGTDAILVVSDLEDSCPKTENEAIKERLVAIEERIGVPVKVIFCVREFETWFLENIDSIKASAPDVNWRDVDLREPTAIRGAKEYFRLLLGNKYRETVDQERFTRHINPMTLYITSRSFRKFVKCVTNLEYSDIDEYLRNAAARTY